jgi:hypothetical protein
VKEIRKEPGKRALWEGKASHIKKDITLDVGKGRSVHIPPPKPTRRWKLGQHGRPVSIPNTVH